MILQGMGFHNLDEVAIHMPFRRIILSSPCIATDPVRSPQDVPADIATDLVTCHTFFVLRKGVVFGRCKVMVEEVECILQARLNLKGNALRSYVGFVGGFNPTEKILVKLDHFPKDRGENKKHPKPPPGTMRMYMCQEMLSSGISRRISWMFLEVEWYPFDLQRSTGFHPGSRGSI